MPCFVQAARCHVLAMLEDSLLNWTAMIQCRHGQSMMQTLATHDLFVFFWNVKTYPQADVCLEPFFFNFKSMFYLRRAAIVVRDVSNWKLSNWGFIPQALNRIFCHSIHHISVGFVSKTPMVSLLLTPGWKPIRPVFIAICYLGKDGGSSSKNQECWMNFMEQQSGKLTRRIIQKYLVCTMNSNGYSINTIARHHT